jgi:NAD+ kinase
MVSVSPGSEPTRTLATPPRPASERRERLHLVASAAPAAQEALAALERAYESVPVEAADVVVVLGGDGFMLESLHRFLGTGRPLFGMNRGTVGFLMNEYAEDGVLERLARADRVRLYPLRMVATRSSGDVTEALAFNEVSLFRQTRQAARLALGIDGVPRLHELVCDGVLVATPAGSTAYNLSANGPVVPLRAALLALTPLSPFRPRRWRGALIPSSSWIQVRVLDPAKRPVSAVADHVEVRDVVEVEVWEDRASELRVLFDPGRDLHERILTEQFAE